VSTATAVRFRDLLSQRASIGPAARLASGVQTPLYDFSGGRPDPAGYPYAALIEATARVMEAEGADALTYGDPLGYAGLRDLVCQKYRLYEGLDVRRDNVIVANGSGHALSLAISSFVDVGDALICEAPTFGGTLNAIRRHGADILDVPVDDDGIDTGAVQRRLEALAREGRRCKLIYTQVNFHNPAGPTMSLRRRKRLIELAQAHETLILEDDAYGDLRFEGDPLPSLYALDDGACVIRAGTLSKILGPGVRLGWLCAPEPMIPFLQGFNFSGGVSPFASRVAVYFLRDHMTEHVAMLSELYRSKRDAMLRGLAALLQGTDATVSRPEGGFFLWLKLPAGTDCSKLAQLAEAASVRYVPGAVCYPNGGGDEYIRLAFSYEPAERCEAGGRLLAAAIRAARA